jgi:hypothetical protein
MKGKTQSNRAGSQQAAAKHEGQSAGKQQRSGGSRQTAKESRGAPSGK